MRRGNSKGFTLIEILMVLILIAVLAAVGINAFVNFRDEAKDAALRSNLAALRAGITAQYAQMQLRCGATATQFPPLLAIQNNDITEFAGCTTGVGGTVPSENEAKIVQGAELPDNPWAGATAADPNGVTSCAAGAGCGRTSSCDGTGTYTEGWCYNTGTGEIWSDTNDHKSW